MLIRFSVQNFRSIRNIISFSMDKHHLKSELVENSFHPQGLSSRHDLLKTSVIYGANASGKSNLVQAINAMRSIICNQGLGNISTEALPEPFLLDKASPRTPIFFEMEFLSHGHHFIYGFQCSRTEIISEWLFGKKQRKILLFARENEKFVKSSPDFPELHVWKKLLHDTHLSLPKEALFLPTMGRIFNGGACAEVLDWFSNVLVPLTTDTYQQYLGYTFKAMEDQELSRKISSFIAKADFGIQSLQIENPPSESSHGASPEPVRIRTTHIVGQQSYTLDMFRHESAGTQKIFALSAPLIDILHQGKVLVLDELDAGLHPLLVSHILELFHEKNNRNAQMVITAHSPAILTETLLRKDQVWFTSKNSDGGTELIHLSDFTGLRKNFSSIAKDYLHGCFGGIPYIQDLYVE